ncbi:MAG: exo-beta-N-acetylmuramidase NamZ domain-containing protein [Fimbriimonadales bacterium]
MPVQNGIDRLEQYLGELKRLRVGVITNHTGLTAEREHLIDKLQRLGVTIGALFSPEHGIRGQLDENVPDSVDERTGLPIYSLYGERKKPTLQQLASLDALIFDIQDIGARYYTYISTMGLAMEAAAERQIPIYVLDRVNPIGGAVEGPLADPDRLSFTAYHTIALRHGMTVGELAQMFNAERNIGATLQVIPCTGWKRSMTLDACGLFWVNPSPNMRRLQQAFLYIGIGVWEATNLSVGRGTDTPFEIIGAPWIDGRKLAGMLHELPSSAGARFVPMVFTPTASVYKGVECQGVSVMITDWAQLRPFALGVGLAYALRKLYPREWESHKSLGLLANREVHAMMVDGAEPERVLQRCARDVDAFTRRREAFLIYP